MMLLVVKYFKNPEQNEIMSILWIFWEQILLIFKVALMVPIKYLISPNVSEKLLETFRKD